MPSGYSHQLDEATSPSSDYSVGPMNSGMYPFAAQTGPSSNQYGSSWDTTGEGPQHFNENFPLSYTAGALTPPGVELDFVAEDFQRCASPRPEKRLPSHSPGVSSTKRRSTKSSVSKGPAKIAPAPSSRSTKSGMAGNAASYRNANNGHYADVNAPLFLDADSANPMAWQYSQDLPLDLDMSSVDAMQFPSLSLHVDPARMQIDPDPSLSATSPHNSWTSLTPPQSPPDVEEGWYQPSLGGSSPESAVSSPPADYGHVSDSKYSYNLVQGMASGDLSATIVAEDTYGMSQAGGSRRGRTEGEAPARDHVLYKTAAPGPDGLFHCPWEGTKECHHKPEKLKCNYDKFVDSHLRPYRCKVPSCSESRFSSTACLLRHEREAHQMHGHQAYNCTYKGCERSQEGRGFPRAWNLKDHMRRVHNDPCVSIGSDQSTGAPEDERQTKSRRRSSKTSTSSSSRKSSKSQVVDAVDQYQQDYADWDDYYRSLQGVVHDMGKPTNPESRSQIRRAQKYLDKMSTVYERVNPNHKNIAPAPARRSHGD